MSQPKNSIEMTKILIRGVPFYLSQDQKVFKAKMSIQKPDVTTICTNTTNNPKRAIKLLSVFKEQIIFESVNKNDEYLKGEYLKLVLRNRLHRLTNSSHTIASYFASDSKKIEKTSTNVIKVIGQKNYDAVFIALCSVISQELKVRAMLALLTQEKSTADASCQTDDTVQHNIVNRDTVVSVYAETGTQTNETNLVNFNKKKNRVKRTVTPLLVKKEPREPTEQPVKSNKIIIDPYSEEDCMRLEDTNKLPMLEFDEESNCSEISNLTFQSDILNSAPVRTLLEGVGNSTQKDKSSDLQVQIQKFFSRMGLPETIKPEDQFHLATQEILAHLAPANRIILINFQKFIDWKLCLESNEEGNLPLHLAVLNEDPELVRRQGEMLRARNYTVDTPAHNGLTALRLSISMESARAAECTAVLLSLGADPLQSSSRSASALHLAAESPQSLHLSHVLSALADRARELVPERASLQQSILQQSDEEVSRHLLLEVSVMLDSQGYTPLMLSAKLGLARNVRILGAYTRETVDTVSPSSGNTALFLAVAEACLSATHDTANSIQVSDNYLQTISSLLDLGADPEIENLSGSKVSDLLQEVNINALSMLIANKISSRLVDPDTPISSTNTEKFMLYKDNSGHVKFIDKAGDATTKRQSDSKNSAKPVILQNVSISTGKDTPSSSKLLASPRAKGTNVTSTIVDVPINIIIKKKSGSSSLHHSSDVGAPDTSSVIKIFRSKPNILNQELSTVKVVSKRKVTDAVDAASKKGKR